jgi:hypothetical protein
MRRTPLAAMLTLLVIVALGGCGGKGGESKGSTTTGPHKPPAHAPAY